MATRVVKVKQRLLSDLLSSRGRINRLCASTVSSWAVVRAWWHSAVWLWVVPYSQSWANPQTPTAVSGRLVSTAFTGCCLYGHHWDLVTILPHLMLYSTGFTVWTDVDGCGNTFRRSTTTESTELAWAAALLRSLCRLLYSSEVVLGLFDSSWDALFSCCGRLHLCILSTLEFRGILKVHRFLRLLL
jgi:hypothetical protein